MAGETHDRRARALLEQAAPSGVILEDEYALKVALVHAVLALADEVRGLRLAAERTPPR
jgi:hypothetical protein